MCFFYFIKGTSEAYWDGASIKPEADGVSRDEEHSKSRTSELEMSLLSVSSVALKPFFAVSF